jgi:preprotein translocase SecE subunit
MPETHAAPRGALVMATTGGGGALKNALDAGPRRSRRTFQLVGEVISELGKVTWPSREATARLTMFVVAIAAVTGVFLSLWDFGFGQAASRFLF